MDQLRKGIGLRGYAQQDPIIAYKQEGYEMFDEMIDRIQTTTISRLLKGRIVRIPAQPQPAPRPVQKAPVAEEKPAPASAAQQSGPAIGDAPQPPKDLMTSSENKQLPTVNKSAKIGRNDPCPCGSGKKYKDCCYWNDNK